MFSAWLPVVPPAGRWPYSLNRAQAEAVTGRVGSSRRTLSASRWAQAKPSALPSRSSTSLPMDHMMTEGWRQSRPIISSRSRSQRSSKVMCSPKLVRPSTHSSKASSMHSIPSSSQASSRAGP